MNMVYIMVSVHPQMWPVHKFENIPSCSPEGLQGFMNQLNSSDGCVSM